MITKENHAVRKERKIRRKKQEKTKALKSMCTISFSAYYSTNAFLKGDFGIHQISMRRPSHPL